MDYTVAIFFVDRAYGGPEEGGWWFDTGEPDNDYARFTRGFRTQKAASDYCKRLENRICR